MKQVFRSLVICLLVLGCNMVARGQTNITQAEYFFDNDPGLGNAISIGSLTPATSISAYSFNANIASLTNGVHTLYVRSKNASGVWSQTNRLFVAKVQNPGGNPNTNSNIVQAEYFFDNDPGQGSGSNITLTAATNIPSLVFNADVTGLSTGVHTLYTRTKDAQGKWSFTNRTFFAKFQPLAGNPNTISNIVKAEYFFNTDPGQGNGVDVPVTAAANISGFVINTNVASLPNGLHTLYVRTKDAQGKWTITQHMAFGRIQGLSPNPNQLSRINKAEYFYDTDPGQGNGVNIPIGPSYNVSSLTFNADVSSLANGMHAIYVRTRDSVGQWSLSGKLYFTKFKPLGTNPHTLSNIIKAEYFYDTDPGNGNGINVPVTAANNVSGVTFNADVNALSNGVHTIYLRTKDAQGQWSIANKAVFAKVQSPGINPHTISNIQRIEYFVDTDPGPGSGVPVTFTSGTNVSSVSFNVDMTVLVNTAHKLYVRSRDAQGKWSITNIFSFNGGTAPLSVKILSFNARLREDKTVILSWITEQERNVQQYKIERSYNASDWTLIGTQAPIGQAGKQSYQMVDGQPGTGIIYYRLTEQDIDGKVITAPICFVTIGEKESNMRIYPNPNNGHIVNIQSTWLQEAEVTVNIISTEGKLYWQKTLKDIGQDVYSITDINLPAGTYFVNLRKNDESVSVKLQVVNN